jgi:hypothetical protein
VIQGTNGGAELTDREDATRIAEALGLRRENTSQRRRKNGRSCEDCFFHRNLLCALDLDEPCSTFRPHSATGLVPPRQPSLLVRDATSALSATH